MFYRKNGRKAVGNQKMMKKPFESDESLCEFTANLP